MPHKPHPTSEYVTFGVLSLLLLIAALIASTLGRFLSYAGLETTLTEAAFQLGMLAAVGGPFVIFVAALVTGFVLYSRGRKAWFVPLVGVAALILNFNLLATYLAG